MTRVLLPFDGSEPAKHALDWLLRPAEILGPIEVRVVNVQPTVSFESITDDLEQLLNEHALARGRRILQPAVGRLAAARLTFTSEVAIGTVADVLVHQVGDHGCDHVVMGTRGLGTIKGLMMGSTAFKMVHLSPVPVTLVR